MRIVKITSVLFFFFISISVSSLATDVIPLKWEKRSGPPLPVVGCGGAAIGDKIYVAVHNGPDHNTKLFIYDTQSDSWAEGPDAPTKREAFTAVALNDKLYVIGGESPNQAGMHGPDTLKTLTSVDVYDPTSNQWSAVAETHVARTVSAAVTVGGKIYLLGGWNGGFDNVGSVEVFDPAKKSWQLLPSVMPQAVRASAYASIGNKIYLFGGCASHTREEDHPCTQSFVQEYDTQTDTWKLLAVKLPIARHFSGQHAFAAGDKIFVLGGSTDKMTTVYDEVDVFDTKTQTFAQATPLPTGRKSSVGAIVNGHLYLIGGGTTQHPQPGIVPVGPQINERALLPESFF